MNTEDDEFNRIEREASMRKAAVAATVSKREWVGLTDEELSGIYNQTDWNVNEDWNYERAIEAKLKEKNT
jgi:hypothetical protein